MGVYPSFNLNYLMFMLPAFFLTVLAQWYVNYAYRTWSRVRARNRMTGVQAAQRLMETANLYDLRLEGISRALSDHYDPRGKVLRLSEDVAYSASVAAQAIVAHELGHALQDQEGFFPLRLRTVMVPAVNAGSTLGWIFIMVGLLIHSTGLTWLGILAFSFGVLFALATLPVELDASARARRLLFQSGLIVDENELRGVNTVLNAAALTYVVALATAVLQLLYFITLSGGMGGRRKR
ncbi:MAG: zinc metallopeptidase [Chloroflexi bacterium]|nr:zinc metallopeptidase [Chloroflexota bacterium]